MADDERRAEIEAIAEAIGKRIGPPGLANEIARIATVALDRVRDARGDDELRSPTLGLPTKRECGVETQDLGEPLGAATRWCRYCSAPLTADHRPWCNIGRGRVRDEHIDEA